MHWGPYEICSVLSGLMCLGANFVDSNMKAKDRMWSVLGGVFFIGFGIYVAQQNSGTYYFSVIIFVLPVLGAGWVLYQLYKRFGATTDFAHTPAGDQRGPTLPESLQTPPAIPATSWGKTEPDSTDAS